MDIQQIKASAKKYFEKLICLRKKYALRNFIHKKWLLWPARFAVVIFIYWIFLELNFLWLFGDMPNMNEVRNPEVAIATEIYSCDSVLIGRFYTENRTPISFKEISPELVKALLCTEDVRFYSHFGFDMKGVMAGIFSSVQGDNRGASTITQQLAKNMFKTRSNENSGLLGSIPLIGTIISKTKEWVTAIKLEIFYSKDEILEMYFNTVEFGNNWFGIKVASQNYFGKQPSQINTQEAATLVGLLKATTTYNPLRYKDRSRSRRNIVLGQMLKYDSLTQKQFDSLSILPIVLKKKERKILLSDDSYLRNVIETIVTPWCAQNNHLLYEDGLKIYTSIDSRLQNNAVEAVQSHIAKLQKEFYSQWGKKNPWVDENGKEIPDFLAIAMRNTQSYKDLKVAYPQHEDSIEFYLQQKHKVKLFTWKGTVDTTISTYDSLKHCISLLQAGMYSIDPIDGLVRAYVGGIDYRYFKYDHVIQAKRQPGSTFKTFAYTAAMDCGYSPCDMFIDQPVSIEYDNQVWQPKNSGGGFSMDAKTLRRAFGQSCNSITAQITEKVGWNTVASFARMMGVNSKLDEVPSICLGSSDVSLYEMINAYGCILNDGYRVKPLFVTDIYDKSGKLLASFKPEKVKVLSDEVCFLMRYMLMGGLQEPGGTSQALWGYKVFENGNEIGGKTGTTSNYSDAWYIALTQNLVTGSWVGSDYRAVHLRGAGGQGSRAALPIVAKYLEKSIAQKNPHLKTGKFPKPKKNIKREYYCAINDSLISDSLQLDSLGIIPDSIPVIFKDTTIHD